ncbi:helix-turn-helix transcriptional regulator [Methylovirgula sp. 4M-Z18]|uniref:helix-turn-helix transcriptional regulator n=1 Tax=Methylovirgula sp. 4M-Z18 TaxID=2293567 RepID=UPI001FDEA617|nr:helix-turn-helix transcriptional regulator [Methylovirgula sp. 4M-Z18]
MAQFLPTQPKTTISLDNAQQLGAFLRARRESLSYQRVGLPRYGRTRTPGLRREEVAQLAQIGVTWYTKLEQGRPIQVSARTLEAIADALQCTPAEKQHLFILAGLYRPKAPADAELTPDMQFMLDQMNPFPAYIVTASYDILGFNESYGRVTNVNLAALAPEDRNCIYLAFVDPNWRRSMPDYEDSLARMVAVLRSAMTGRMDEPHWRKLFARYTSLSPVFTELWERNQVCNVENLIKRFYHPKCGEYRLQQRNWWSAPRDGLRMSIYVPLDDEGRAALNKIAAGIGWD